LLRILAKTQHEMGHSVILSGMKLMAVVIG
jgi:hypothetical protein